MVFPVFIPEQITGALNCMTGSMQHLQLNFTNRKGFTISSNGNRKPGFGFRSKNNWSNCSLRKVDMAANKIGVKMCFENVFDSNVTLYSQVQIFFYIP